MAEPTAMQRRIYALNDAMRAIFPTEEASVFAFVLIKGEGDQGPFKAGFATGTDIPVPEVYDILRDLVDQIEYGDARQFYRPKDH